MTSSLIDDLKSQSIQTCVNQNLNGERLFKQNTAQRFFFSLKSLNNSIIIRKALKKNGKYFAFLPPKVWPKFRFFLGKKR